MYLQKCILLKFILLIFIIKRCLCEVDNNLETFDCNCDVQIDVVQNMLQKLHKIEKRMEKIEAQNEAKQLENLESSKRTFWNCLQAAAGNFESGIYHVQISSLDDWSTFEVWCDTVADFGGWTVFQRRVSGDEDFNRGWNDYKNGFGNLSSNFWLGLDKLHALTTSCEHELYIKMENFNGTKYYAKYDRFVVGNEEENYVLKSVGKYIGTAENDFTYHKGKKFATYDRNNQFRRDTKCVRKGLGGWWYKNGWTRNNLNGIYRKDGNYIGIFWIFMNGINSLKFTEMMIRPTDNCKKRHY